MIVCSCAVISDRDIEQALIEILNSSEPPIPTPGVVFRHMQRRMKCCGCAPLAVETIYTKMTELAERGLICADKGALACGRLMQLAPRQRSGTRHQKRQKNPALRIAV